jgi:hypothetical protein
MSLFPSNTFTTSFFALLSGGTPYVALYTSNPTAADVGTEVAGGSYARKAITWAAPSGGSMANSNTITFNGLPAANVTHFGIRSASSGGDLLVYGPITAVATLSGDEVGFAIGAIVVTFAGS